MHKIMHLSEENNFQNLIYSLTQTVNQKKEQK